MKIGDVWCPKSASKVEYVIKGIPRPDFIFLEREDNGRTTFVKVENLHFYFIPKLKLKFDKILEDK